MLKIKESRIKSYRSKASHCSWENDKTRPSQVIIHVNLMQEGASIYLVFLLVMSYSVFCVFGFFCFLCFIVLWVFDPSVSVLWVFSVTKSPLPFTSLTMHLSLARIQPITNFSLGITSCRFFILYNEL